MKKKLYPSFRCQLADYKISVLVYYTVVLALLTLTFFTALFHKVNVVASGISSASVIFLFVCGLCAFKENFGMSLQNGVSRRTMFTARLCVTFILAVGMALIDELLCRVFGLLGAAFLGGTQVYATLFDHLFEGQGNWDALGVFLLSAAFNFALCLAASSLGYFITIMFYRLNKMGKILVGAGVPAFFMFVPPVLKTLDSAFFGETLRRIAWSVEEFLFSIFFDGIFNVLITCFLIFLAFSLFAWLLLRKAVIK